MEALKCKTAKMCEKKLWVYFLAYNLIRLLMAEAVLRTDTVPRQLSFKHTLQQVAREQIAKRGHGKKPGLNKCHSTPVFVLHSFPVE